jgi:hypothetical protein
MTRYTVRTDKIPEQLRVRFFVAWINDANHPDDPDEGASISWHMSLDDAGRVCDLLNMADHRIRKGDIMETLYRG